MRTSSDGPPTDAQPWTVLVSSARGAAHGATGLPNQDASAWRVLEGLGPPLAVAAIADGHGHPRHFRAERGALLAVEQACAGVERLAAQLPVGRSGGALAAFARETLVPSVVEAWRRAVAADLAASAFTPDEEAIRAQAADEPVIAYGATLLLTALSERWVLVAQIGDGDVVALLADGRVETPVPADPTLDGHYTTSLCQAAAIDSFRIAVIDRSTSPLLALLLATDGFGNAQASDPWPPAVGADLISMLRTDGVEWVRGQLPIWTERCASTAGSGDDTTVVLAVCTA